ncbi:hypothetical protein M441DRAFT_329617 [Trichoderma asperellum CBS 433.97]|uniref:Uncharacterized protein n=1 Tax=Trichoderma asperellum (strain ATCC 204424 / CBS 433.97 / NBRC 101777) TaxID=1042311 RepID=A0A2T3YSL9_TRIA4|nr:hypothetical protein M441DRAFT_329617 [Trichoderma asperellum CBS 433.97]PTB35514.1 hypothetical protein M441DRAFT_329617 [Trichoderma asperellum CBS 433.97]
MQGKAGKRGKRRSRPQRDGLQARELAGGRLKYRRCFGKEVRLDVFGSEFKRDNAMRILVFAVVSMWVCSSRGPRLECRAAEL